MQQELDKKIIDDALILIFDPGTHRNYLGILNTHAVSLDTTVDRYMLENKIAMVYDAITLVFDPGKVEFRDRRNNEITSALGSMKAGPSMQNRILRKDEVAGRMKEETSLNDLKLLSMGYCYKNGCPAMLTREEIHKFSDKEEFLADATLFSWVDANDVADDAAWMIEIANAEIPQLIKKIAWYQDVLDGDSSLTGFPSTFVDSMFANEINIAYNTTKQHYQNYMFREALKSGFCELWTAREEYKFSCGVEGYNHDLETNSRNFIAHSAIMQQGSVGGNFFTSFQGHVYTTHHLMDADIDFCMGYALSITNSAGFTDLIHCIMVPKASAEMTTTILTYSYDFESIVFPWVKFRIWINALMFDPGGKTSAISLLNNFPTHGRRLMGDWLVKILRTSHLCNLLDGLNMGIKQMRETLSFHQMWKGFIHITPACQLGYSFKGYNIGNYEAIILAFDT